MNDAICIIMARRESTRLIEKHIQEIEGVTLIRRAIDKVLEANLFDHVLLSTNCPDCMREAENAGVDYFERAPELCQQNACLANAFRDAVDKSVEIYGKLHRWGCFFQPTHFLVSVEFLRKMYDIISNPATDNPRASDQPWSSVITGADSSGLFPWFVDLRPGVAACRQRVLDYFEFKDEISVDIHNQQDLERARLLYKWKEGLK